MIQPGENTLRSRAAAAISRRRLDEQLHRELGERLRCGWAAVLLKDKLDVDAPCSCVPVELDGLEFTAEERGREWALCLLQPCRSVQQGRHYRDCAEQVRTPIHCLADLGEALEQGPRYCAGCEA